jgi:selenocysteine-specific elongation factor
VPERPVLHLGSALVGVHARPLGKDYYRLTLDEPLPLRIGDRAILRDPGSRTLWGAVVLDPQPPPLGRRGAAAARAAALTDLESGAVDELRVRGVVRRDLLRRIGAPVGDGPVGGLAAGGGDAAGVGHAKTQAGGLAAGEWLVSAERAGELRAALTGLAEAAGVHGITPAAAAHALDLPDPAIVAALVAEPLRASDGRIRVGGPALPEPLAAALAGLRAHLAEQPFAAPTAEQLDRLGLDATSIAVLHRDGHVLRIAPGIVLLPDAAAAAVERLAALAQPFTTSAARQALGTSRRVALPLLAHLDATGATVRQADDTRRLAH